MAYENQLVVMVASAGDGAWHQFGAEPHDAGIVPENFQMGSVMPGGINEFSFDLSRSARRVWPDLLAMSQVEVYIGGRKVAAGRIRETPSTTEDVSTITITCEGPFHYLEDEMVRKVWVHNDMRAWKDIRTYDNFDDGNSTRKGQVSKDHKKGVISIGWNDGANIASNESVGIMIDLGKDADKRMDRIDVRVAWQGTHGNFDLVIRTGDHVGGSGTAPATGNLNSTDLNLATGASTTDTVLSAFFGALPDNRSRRFISVFVKNSSGSLVSGTNDVNFTIKQIQMYRDGAYATVIDGASSSLLKASDIAVELIDNHQPVIAAALTTDSPPGYIEPSTYPVPQHDSGGYKSIKDILDSVNAYDGADWWVDMTYNLHWKQPHDAPDYVTHLAQGAHLTLAGSSGQDLYNRVIVEGQDEVGNPVTVTRTYDDSTYNNDAPQPTNGDFEVDTSNWHSPNGTIARSTTHASTGTASLAVSTVASGTKFDAYTNAWSTVGWIGGKSKRQFTFIEGEKYRVTMAIRTSTVLGAAGGIKTLNISILDSLSDESLSDDGDSDGNSSGDAVTTVSSSQFLTYQRTFIADSNYPLFELHISGTTTTGPVTALWLDAIYVERANTGTLGALNTRRTALISVNGNIKKADGHQIGAKFLAAHGPYPPLRGTLTVTGTGMVTDAQSGEPVPPWRITPGDVVLVADLPTTSTVKANGASIPTGALGRQAKVVGTTYDHNTRSAQIELDNSRDWTWLLNRRLRLKVA